MKKAHIFSIILLLFSIQLMSSQDENDERFSPEVNQKIRFIKEWQEESKALGDIERVQICQEMLERTAQTRAVLDIPDAEYVDMKAPSFCKECLVGITGLGLFGSCIVFENTAPDDFSIQCLNTSGMIGGMVTFLYAILATLEKYNNFKRYNEFCKSQHHYRLAELAKSAESKKMK
ncbi:MAG TPA: hypothetical protein VLG50_00140 [Candidatus Saccharimonadales bacterium]|nr:hypothetical protein [Candidatus Saccharimonadales bacterium]